MTVYLVTRHAASMRWMAAHVPASAGVGQVIESPHMGPEEIASLRAGDVVIGILPRALAADVCERGARYFALVLSIPRELRGMELSAEQVADLGPELVEYHVRRIGVVS